MILRVFIVSAVVHTAAFVAVVGAGGHAPTARATAMVPVELVDVEDEKTPPAHVPEAQVQSDDTAPAPASQLVHTHPYPVPADHDAKPHAADEQHVSAPAGTVAPRASADEAPVAEPRVESPPRFTMSNHGTAHVHGDGSHGAGEATGPSTPAREEPLGEDRVSFPAKLLGSAPAAYPPDARSSQMEADVGLNIVVDAAGHVTDARVTKPAGSGFDESALRAIRSYRFSAALRDGRPVAVRMRWNVQFRLQ